jgi:hypothetical protein
MSCSRRAKAGRSRFAPVKPPSSYFSAMSCQPRHAWRLMYCSQASRWASSELKSWSRPADVDLRV